MMHMKSLTLFIKENAPTIILENITSGNGFEFTIDPNTPHKKLSPSDFNMSEDDYLTAIMTMLSTKRTRGKIKGIDKLDEFKKTKLGVFVSNLYDVWNKKYGKNPAFVPFRFTSDRQIKLARVYGLTVVDLGYKWSDSSSPKVNVGDVSIQYGNGLGGGGSAGMDFEHALYDGLREWIFAGMPEGTDKTIYGNFANGDVAVCDALYGIANSTGNPNTEIGSAIRNLLKGVVFTSKEDVDKHIHNPAPSKRPFATDVAGDGSFETSGNKIADIIITRVPMNIKDDKKFDVTGLNEATSMFISVKKESHQWTGSTINPNVNGKNWLGGALAEPNYEKVNNEFKNFWNNEIGVDAKVIWERLNPKVRMRGRQILTPNDLNVGKNNIYSLCQKLLGTNYWIVKEGDDEFIHLKYELKSGNAQIESIEISKSQSTESLSMIIKCDKCSLSIRTAGGMKLNVRMFPILSEDQFNEMIK